MNNIDKIKAKALKIDHRTAEGLLFHEGETVPTKKLAFDASYDVAVHRFNNLEALKRSPGLYQIHTFDGIPLKVGIAANLRHRLTQHARSLQGKLKPIADVTVSEPGHLRSKQSILAKHLYFDRALTENYDLETEVGRQNLLAHETYLLVTYTPTRDEALRLEKIAEASNIWRYQGRVKIIDG